MSEHSYFTRIDETRFMPTKYVTGAWHDDEQHFSPVGGLMTHAIERERAHGEGSANQLSRISFDILGRISRTETEVFVETVRPGRTIELVEATAMIGGRPVVRARAWFLAGQDTSVVAGGAPDPLPAPETLQSWPMSSVWPRDYIASLETRVVELPRPGRTTAWVRTPISLVADEAVSDVASFVSLIDTANGIAVRRHPSEWMFPNVDLTVHFHRQPQGEWVGLDTSVVFGSGGLGVTSTVLHDVFGAVGVAQQSLTVRPL